MDSTTKTTLLTKSIIKNLQWKTPEEILSELDEVIVFGTGKASECVTQVLKKYKVKIFCYADNDASKQNKSFLGKAVIPPDGLKKSSYVVIIASLWARDIAKQLFDLGCKYLDFSFFVDFPRWKDHFNYRIFDAKKACEVGQKYLAGEDLISYLSCIRYRQTYNPLELAVPGFDHYMSKSVAPNSNDIYIDGGAWQGDTLLELKKLCGNSIEVHCFEPDEKNYSSLEETIAKSKISNFYLVKKALWNEDTLLRFVTSTESVHTMQSRVSTNHLSNDKFTEVLAITLDNYSDTINKRPTYIKLDIEGAEPQALEGASTLLRESPPKLAISAYHEPNHLWQLIEQIAYSNSNYRFWFVHHSQHLFESVIYAKVGN